MSHGPGAAKAAHAVTVEPHEDAADVLDAEPPAPNHPLIGAPNCIITSHIASRTHESVQRQANRCLNNAINFFAGADDVLCANGVL